MTDISLLVTRVEGTAGYRFEVHPIAQDDPAVTPTAEPSILDLLDLEEIDTDLYRGRFVFDDPYPLYGGQVAAQALLAAGLTVGPGRMPHSLHGYYLRSGDSSRPTIFRVERDRDGRSYSARRVVALQGGKVIFNMSASFHVAEDGADQELSPAPEVPDPDELAEVEGMPRLFSMEGKIPPQPFPNPVWPTRTWARCTADLPADPLIHASVLTYLSDFSSGLLPLNNAESVAGSSLDHAIWFHRVGRLDEWVLMDLVPQSTSGGRGFYNGTIRSRSGILIASLTQEALFRNAR